MCIVVQIYEDEVRREDVTFELQGRELDELVLDVVLPGSSGDFHDLVTETWWIDREVAFKMRDLINRFLSS